MKRDVERREFLKTTLGAAAAASTPLIAGSAFAATSTAPQTYSRDEVIQAGSDFLGVTVEALGGAIEKIFADYGEHPTAYVAGEEASGAVGIGLRYGRGNLFMKSEATPRQIYWQGPSIGFDTGGNASRVFTLVYNLFEYQYIYRRFPGVEGAAYFIGGLGVNYLQAEGIIMAPIRAGVGLRLGANVGYVSFSAQRRIFPL